MFCNVLSANIVLRFTAAEYYVTNVSTTWNNVLCTLATPKLDYTADGIIVNETLGRYLSDGALWIGYYYAYKSFQYYGMHR